MLKQEHIQKEVKSGFVGEISNNTITCDKLYIDMLNFRIAIDVSAELIQKDESLLIKTSIIPRKFEFRKLSIFLKISLIICIGSLVFGFGTFLALAIATSNPQILIVCLVSLIGGFMIGLALLNNAKEKALASATEELKKKFELAYLRARNN